MIAYLDCSTGVSGDKFLGALIDAGFDVDMLRRAVAVLGLASVRIEALAGCSHGARGVGLAVTEPGAPRRNWPELRRMLGRGGLPGTVLSQTVAALEAIAVAESRAHGVDVEDVHFHEIGAADTLVDALGVALALHELGITEVVCSPVAVGSGTVETEHGPLAVPAPATAILLQDAPIVAGPVGGELTTPTGAALLRTHASAFGVLPPMILRRTGAGCGTRDLGVPNICRLLVGEAMVEDPGLEDVVLLESNIDHLTAEELATACERLRAAGALDVWQTPVVMKKGRAATVLAALSKTEAAPSLAERLIAETGTLGVRMMPASRRVVERDVAEIETSLGRARFKIARLPQGRVLRIEADDAARIAAEAGLAVDDTAARLEAEACVITGFQPMRRQLPSEDAKPSG